jgi:tRNA dimethylallyltransferase
MKTVPFLVGPTGIGKTYLSILIARKLPVEIVSADSRQIYRFLDIGTAKPAENVLKEIPHHFINFLRPDEYFSAGMFSRLARKVIKQIQQRDRIPLVVGGSGLYVNALIDGFFNLDIRDEKIRLSLRHRLASEGIAVLYAELQDKDPVLAEKITLHDKQRIIRGLEVFMVSGKRLSELQEEESVPADFFPLMYGITSDRKLMYERINRRVESMFEDGLLAEVANLRRQGLSPGVNALNTVGYKEVFNYLDDNSTYEEMVELIKRNSRHYAKRQMTWFNRDERIQWYHVTAQSDYAQLADELVEDFWTRQAIATKQSKNKSDAE